ncbi:MAG: hypothetical protein AAB425_13335, partial [Bdellovibrionota bacterium]
HVEASSISLDALNEATSKSKITHMVLMGAPEATYNPSSDFSKTVTQFAASGGTTYKFLYGGDTLQPILHGIARPGAASVTLADLFPNGGGSEIKLTEFLTVVADPTTYEATFKTLATASVTSGLYAGFGELGPEHFSRKVGQPDVQFPVNHGLMMWLSDLAATNSMVLDIHLESTPQTLAEFADLLAHNRSTKIIWEHAGWSNTGNATATRFAQMLLDHPNLYLALKYRPSESNEMREGSILDEQGLIKPEWYSLLSEYSNRVMIGLDVKMGSDGKNPSSTLAQAATPLGEVFHQLPSDVAEAIANLTAKNVYGL